MLSRMLALLTATGTVSGALAGTSSPHPDPLTAWREPDCRRRRQIEIVDSEATHGRFVVPEGVSTASMRLVVHPEMMAIPHWRTTLAMTAPRELCADASVHYGFPRIVRAGDGSLLLFYRVGTSHAGDAAAIAMRRSTDDGAHWSEQRLLHRDPDGYCAHNPVAAVTPEQRVLLFVSRYDWKQNLRRSMLWSWSEDHGRTWRPFVRFDRDESRSSYYMTDVISTADGLVGAAATFAPPGKGQAHDIIWRSRQGHSWEAMTPLLPPSANRGDEVALLETTPGTLMLLLRDRGGQGTFRMWSSDAGNTWSAPESVTEMVDVLQRPFLTRLDEKTVLLTGRDRPRKLVVAHVSRDNGRTFAEKHVVDRYLVDGGYTSAVVLDDRRVLLVYYADAEAYPGKPDVRQTVLSLLDPPYDVSFALPSPLAANQRLYAYLDPDPQAQKATEDRTRARMSPVLNWSAAVLSQTADRRDDFPNAQCRSWQGRFDGSAGPMDHQPPWEVVRRGTATCGTQDGAWFHHDAGSAAGDMVHCGRPWPFVPGCTATVEVCLKVDHCSGPGGAMLLLADGDHEEVFTFFPDRLHTNRSRLEAPLDLASDFVSLKIEVTGRTFRVSKDEQTVLEGVGQFSAPAHRQRRIIQFGSRSSASQGKAYWRHLHYRIDEP